MNNLLYVEDDPIDVMIFQREVGRLLPTAEIEIARSGEEAVTLLGNKSETAWSGIVVDIHMPGMGGHAFIAEVRRRESMGQVPIVTFSTSVINTEHQVGLDRGADDYVLKSCTSACYEELLDKLRRAASARANPAASTPMTPPISSPEAGPAAGH